MTRLELSGNIWLLALTAAAIFCAPLCHGITVGATVCPDGCYCEGKDMACYGTTFPIFTTNTSCTDGMRLIFNSMNYKEKQSTRANLFDNFNCRTLQSITFIGGKLTGFSQGTFSGISMELLNVKEGAIVLQEGALQGVAKIGEMDFSSCNLSIVDKSFSSSANTTKIELDSLPDLSVTGSPFVQLPTLKSLTIEKTLLNYRSGLFDNGGKLLYLSLQQTGLTAIDETTFADVSSIDTLDIQNNPIVSVHTKAFTALSKLTTITIDLTENSTLYLDAFYDTNLKNVTLKLKNSSAITSGSNDFTLSPSSILMLDVDSTSVAGESLSISDKVCQTFGKVLISCPPLATNVDYCNANNPCGTSKPTTPRSPTSVGSTVVSSTQTVERTSGPMTSTVPSKAPSKPSQSASTGSSTTEAAPTPTTSGKCRPSDSFLFTLLSLIVVVYSLWMNV